jgi:subtilase family serine protease
VDAPASIPEVTGVGGTTFNQDPSSNVTTTYWNASNTATGGSALGYIPEIVWNDTLANGFLSAGGGGASTLFAKPSWQVATNMPADGKRDVPDISLSASADHDPHLLCTNNSCVAGFTDGSGNVQIAAGTSVAAPTFAGLVAIINQGTGSRQGNINPTLYSLAVSTPNAFHDIDTGSNNVPCATGSPDCPSAGVIGFVADLGYDQASGLGSVDANALVTAWPLDFSLTADPNRVAIAAPGVSGTSTITLNPIGSFSGTVSLTCTPQSGVTGLTCAISPASVTPTNPTATLTISTTGPGVTALATRPSAFGGMENGAARSLAASFQIAFDRHKLSLLSLLLFASAFLGASLLCARSKGKILVTFLMLGISAVLMLMPACGSKNGGGNGQKGTPPGNYSITINAASGTVTYSTTVTVGVQ